jgi:hypothetical protein
MKIDPRVVCRLVLEQRDELVSLSHRIHVVSELTFAKHGSSAAGTTAVEDADLTVASAHRPRRPAAARC